MKSSVRSTSEYLKGLAARAARTAPVLVALSEHLERSSVIRSVSRLGLTNIKSPYSNLPVPEPSVSRARDDVVFITGRFRAGTTALWNAFRSLPDVTAYYEPFNERRFFDAGVRGDHVDSTHLGVSDYAAEYDGLGCLADFYRESWIEQNLYMSEDSFDPDMQRYVEILVEEAKGRPVLQFNRIDFRLPWLRRKFPHAFFLHIHRCPREQWLSVVTHGAGRKSVTHAEPFVDVFYQRRWLNDLRHAFPFLAVADGVHPYVGFYLLWKTSLIFGDTFADLSVSLDDLVESKEETLKRIGEAAGIGHDDLQIMGRAIQARRAQVWTSYADVRWFEHHEAMAERAIQGFFS